MESGKDVPPLDDGQGELFGDLPRKSQETLIARIEHPVWTENKAKLIERYLYYFVMITHHGTYIDGFAGPQWPRKPSMWAARLVLQSKPKWLRHFYLYEIKKKKAYLLKKLKANKLSLAPGRTIHVYQGDFNSKVRGLLRSDRIGQQEATFCLLDQQTFECHWKTLVDLARYKRGSENKIELFYFLAIRWLHRALSGIGDKRSLKRWWGRSDWDELPGLTQDQIRDRLVARFKDELGYKSAAPWPIFQRRGSDVIMYYMIHATDHSEAPKLMSRAYRKVVVPRESYEQLSLELGLRLPQTGEQQASSLQR
jgi:three-Cys-motif partner protein